MATHSNILAWRIPWTEEPGRLPLHSQTRLKRLSMHALVSTHQMPVAAYSLVMTSKNVSGHCQMSLEGREAKSSWPRTSGLK